jgi:hypothetical protein
VIGPPEGWFQTFSLIWNLVSQRQMTPRLVPVRSQRLFLLKRHAVISPYSGELFKTQISFIIRKSRARMFPRFVIISNTEFESKCMLDMFSWKRKRLTNLRMFQKFGIFLIQSHASHKFTAGELGYTIVKVSGHPADMNFAIVRCCYKGIPIFAENKRFYFPSCSTWSTGSSKYRKYGAYLVQNKRFESG